MEVSTVVLRASGSPSPLIFMKHKKKLQIRVKSAKLMKPLLIQMSEITRQFINSAV